MNIVDDLARKLVADLLEQDFDTLGVFEFIDDSGEAPADDDEFDELVDAVRDRAAAMLDTVAQRFADEDR